MKRYLNFFIVIVVAIQGDLFAAEAGMPQLDPKYWASQAFWLVLVFIILYFSIDKFYLPKIKNNLDDRDSKIKDDVEDASKFKELSENKFKEYEKILEDTKKEVIKIQLDSKAKLDKDIKEKKEKIENEIEKEVAQAQKEITELKKNSISDIQKISKEIAANIIENIAGDKLNESSVRATVEEISKKNTGKYL
jgi:F-type H+-transporting ATPase subunit b